MTRENFSFMHLISYKPALWTKIKAQAIRKYEPDKAISCDIIATDINEKMVEAAIANAEAAGAEDRIRFEVADIMMSPVPESEKRGTIVINPPYGNRMGDHMLLRDTYVDISAFLEDNSNS
ncbi:MAG: hypothetical protein GX804_06140 [Lentisphaerae bacterium]|nr:hypothetical protein [Lentisphaerota bacterium]